MQSWMPAQSVALSATVLCLCLWLSRNGVVHTQGAKALERRHSTATFSERTVVSCAGNVRFFVRKASKDKCPRLMGVGGEGGTFYSCPS